LMRFRVRLAGTVRVCYFERTQTDGN
jgi:hypothetical protein